MTSINSLAEVSFDIIINLQNSVQYGSDRFTIKNETTTRPTISQCFDNDIQLSSETYHSLIKLESENL